MPEHQEKYRADELAEVLRYWLGAVRFEEALAVRPKASRQRSVEVIDLIDPQGQQPYFKLTFRDECLEFLGLSEPSIDAPVEGEVVQFTAQWLRRLYRRQRRRWTTEENNFGGLIGWPAIYFPRGDELGSLFRFRATLNWQSADGARFEPPSYSARKAGRVPAPPTAIQIKSIVDEEGGLMPYSLDDRLLTQTLGVADEELADLYDVLRGAQELSAATMIATVSSLLMSDNDWAPALSEVSEDENLQSLVDTLLQGIGRRLPPGRRAPKVYPVGLVYDGSQVQTTHHLQRDLTAAIDRIRHHVSGMGRTPLGVYLSGDPEPDGWAPLMGLHHAEPLTDYQRQVAETFLASRFSAAQGPPGTGKTRLIIDLVAGQMVERIRNLASSGRMDDTLLVVSSTNNRAVDNVFDELGREGHVIGLRTGSQHVTGTRTLNTLEAVLRWVEGMGTLHQDEATALFETELAVFQDLYSALEAMESSRHQMRRNHSEKKSLDRQIHDLEQLLDSNLDAVSPPELIALKRLRVLCRTLAPRLTMLLDRLEDGAAGLEKARRHYRRSKTQFDGSLSEVFEALSAWSRFELPGPPQFDGTPDGFADQWADEVSASITALDELRERVDQALKHRKWREDLVDLRADRAALESPLSDGATPNDEREVARRHHRLFQHALSVRRAWVQVNRRPLLDMLKLAIEATSQRRSLRRLLDGDGRDGRLLRQLFPVVGSTLLSMGNVFSLDGQKIDRLVIDEGGQCHPAYAVSGLMRARSALIIGDTHQLQPVVQLSEDDEARVQRTAKLTVSLDRLTPYRLVDQAHISAQALADRAVPNRPTLTAHFRCQPEIIRICDYLCHYGLEVRTPVLSGPLPLPSVSDRVALWPVTGAQERVRGSWHNAAEREAVTSLLKALRHAGVSWSEIAVITPYVGQLEKIRDDLKRHRIPWQGSPEFEEWDSPLADGVALGTVHRFQGGERRVVIFSTVVTQSRSLAFINQRVNLMNVAISRAREQLLVVGAPDTLNQGEFTRILVQNAAYCANPIG